MGRGSAGNVIAADHFDWHIVFVIIALFMFVMTFVLWLILLGWVIHLWSIIDAAVYDPPERRRYRYDRHRRYGRYA